MKGFNGMPGNMNNMQGMLKQIQKMQDELQKTATQAEEFTADGQAGGGMVKAVANGKMEIISLEIREDIVDPKDIEGLSITVMGAVNNALREVQQKKKEAIEQVTGGVSIPGLI